ncbi:MAG: flagellar export protein FliJ [Phycisphaerales bacterium]|nr:MAG: flagellar export protein FliJ [Phycisphaerales bacterium]
MAKRFQFRLEAVLKVRKRKRDEARRIVADRQRRIGRIAERITACRNGIGEAVEESRRVQHATAPDVTALRRYRSYIAAMDRAIGDAEIAMSGERDRLREEQRQLARANKEVKAIEKLRERQLARHCEQERRADRAEGDEISLQLHRRARITA